jgi:Protein of unknown function (DUF3592)
MPGFRIFRLPMTHFQITWLWIALASAVILIILRGFWLYRASLTWPAADGVITLLQIERQRDAGTPSGHYFAATFTYDFRDPAGNRVSGNWRKDFSSEANAREFAARELPVGKKVVVRYSPRNPTLNDLELDSWTYAGDRPTTLSI